MLILIRKMQAAYEACFLFIRGLVRLIGPIKHRGGRGSIGRKTSDHQGKIAGGDDASPASCTPDGRGCMERRK